MLSEPWYIVFTEDILKSRFSLELYSSVVCVKVKLQFHETGMFYLKHRCSKTLDVSMMSRVWSIFLKEFFIRWHFIILNTSLTSSMLMLYFVVILTAVKHPNQWAVINLFVKKELIKGLLVTICICVIYNII